MSSASELWELHTCLAKRTNAPRIEKENFCPSHFVHRFRSGSDTDTDPKHTRIRSNSFLKQQHRCDSLRFRLRNTLCKRRQKSKLPPSCSVATILIMVLVWENMGS
jgi:hypothetical protein